MKTETLATLRCPSRLDGKPCQHALAISETPAPIFELGELVEGLLHCPECNAAYPVLFGLGILVPDASDYLQRNFPAILQVAFEQGLSISPAMSSHLKRSGAALQRRSASRNSEDDLRGLSTYLNAHYDHHSAAAARLPEGHPLKVFLNTYRGQNLYDRLFGMAADSIQTSSRVLDIGCHVGRLLRDAAARGAHVTGIDLSFPAAFTARRALLGYPTPLEQYEYFRDASLRETRQLDLPPFASGEVIVASAANLPFDPDSFNVVLCANVLDILPDPMSLLKEARRVLCAGGSLALSTPYHDAAAEAASRWLGSDRRMSAAQLLRWRIGHFFKIIAEQDDVPWVLENHERRLTIYLNHCLLGKKEPA